MTAFDLNSASPSSWVRTRIKHICQFMGGGTPETGQADYWGGDIPWVSPKDMKSSEITDTEDHLTGAGLDACAGSLIQAGAVVLVMRSGILRHSIPVAINRVPVALNQDMRALLPVTPLRARYLARFIEGHQAELLKLWSKEGTTVESLESDLVGDTEVAVPPQWQQDAIADYLDAETARLDGLMACKERVLRLLAEKRRGLISHVVTRGLDPHVALADSGVPWLGAIPAHWGVERARWLFQERDERSESGQEELLTVSHLTGVTPRSQKDVNMFEADTTEGYKICLPGDLVINTLWAWMGAMGVAAVKGIVSPAYNVYQTGPTLVPAFVDALVRIPLFAQEVTRYSKGVWSSRLRLYPEGFFEVFFPVPPIREQEAIVAHIAREVAKIESLGAATTRTIALLKERRTALIAAAVTGRIDVTAERPRRDNEVGVA